MAKRPSWDAELYEAQHGFVWKYGESLIELLDPKPGERILDLGCGTGQLTQKIAERGADVLGLDASPEMIGQARQNFPSLRFVLQDATAMSFAEEFDAVFSNAALHWIPDATAVAQGIFRALRMGGRMVAELGGKGNIRQIESAIETVLRRYLGDSLPLRRTFFPSVSEYAGLLEECGLEVRSAALFDRFTPLEGDNGMEQWLRQFASYYFEAFPREQAAHARLEVAEKLRSSLFEKGRWHADYRRLRIYAVKP
jgi:trans-aconitate 2-methyltransferase